MSVTLQREPGDNGSSIPLDYKHYGVIIRILFVLNRYSMSWLQWCKHFKQKTYNCLIKAIPGFFFNSLCLDKQDKCLVAISCFQMHAARFISEHKSNLKKCVL